MLTHSLTKKSINEWILSNPGAPLWFECSLENETNSAQPITSLCFFCPQRLGRQGASPTPSCPWHLWPCREVNMTLKVIYLVKNLPACRWSVGNGKSFLLLMGWGGLPAFDPSIESIAETISGWREDPSVGPWPWFWEQNYDSVASRAKLHGSTEPGP